MLSDAQHRPAVAPRHYSHDAYRCLDLFSGFGGLSQGMENAGFAVIYAANHNQYKVEIHEANHPGTEHWIADLVDTDAPSYHDVRDLPPADVVVAGVSCVNHSQANTKKAYAEGRTLFDLDDPEFTRGYDGVAAYRRSKFALAAHTFTLAEELAGTGVAVNVLHPATYMATGMVHEAGITPWNTVADGAPGVLALATQDLGSGGYYDGTTRARAHARTYDPEMRKRLAAVTDQLLNI